MVGLVRKVALGACLAFLSPLLAPEWDRARADPAAAPLVDLQFSTKDVIDKPGYADRNPRQLYFFHLLTPSHERKYEMMSEGETDFDVWLDSKVRAPAAALRDGAAPRSIGMKITSTYQKPVKDKIVIKPVLTTDDAAIDISDGGKARYVSFEFMLDPDYEVPSGWLIHMQAWQCCSFSPPFAIQVTPGHDRKGPVELTFNVRDDDLETEHFGKEKIIYKMPVSRGAWNRMVLKLDPSYDGSSRVGNITLWVNGAKTFSYDGYWGYKPDPHPKWAPHWNPHTLNTNKIGIEFGNYRGRQPTTQIVYFNNIKVGETFESVAGP